MFYYNFVRKCNEIGKAPSTVAEEMGFKRSVVTSWKNGRTPRSSTLLRIAEYFNCNIEELTESEEKPVTSSDGSKIVSIVNEANLTDKQKELIRLAPRLTDQELAVLLPQIRGIIFDR